MKTLLLIFALFICIGAIEPALAQNALADVFQSGYDWLAPTVTIVATFAIFFMAAAILTRGFSIGYAIALLLAIGIAVNAGDIAQTLTG